MVLYLYEPPISTYMGTDFKHTHIHYIREQLAASQQGALGQQKLSHTERTLTMVSLEDSVPASASHQAQTFSKNLSGNCTQMNCIKCPNVEIFVRLFLMSLPVLSVSTKRKINLHYEERQKLCKSKANRVQFGSSLPKIIISKNRRGIENLFILLSCIKNNFTSREELLFH